MERVIALAGNPNVGKSTVFNALTGMKQHTGNWPGKTVGSATGTYEFEHVRYRLVDLPGTYSLAAHSAEEEIAASFLCFDQADAVVVVCDATCLERNLVLVLQTLAITNRVVVCVNLLDEARKKQITVDLKKLEKLLGVPVVGTSARSGKGLHLLRQRVAEVLQKAPRGYQVRLTAALEEAVTEMNVPSSTLPERFVALQRLLPFSVLEQAPAGFFETPFASLAGTDVLWEMLQKAGVTKENVSERIAACHVLCAEELAMQTVQSGVAPDRRDRMLDRVLTGKITGIPVMIALLCLVLWITMVGANSPSAWLSALFAWLEGYLRMGAEALELAPALQGLLIDGIYRVLTNVIAVMLPPMAIFFPMFTLLEDFGYLPRVAFNLDHCFQKAHTCGKQALTMCMGLGCNAVGVTGCRIIDSPRERLVAILTNSFMPCNGRFAPPL